MKLLLACLITLLPLRAADPPLVLSTYWDAAMLARYSAALPMPKGTPQSIQAFVFSRDAVDAYRVRIDYRDHGGSPRSQEKIVALVDGVAYAYFLDVEDVTYLSTTVTPLTKSGDSTTVQR